MVIYEMVSRRSQAIGHPCSTARLPQRPVRADVESGLEINEVRQLLRSSATRS